MIREFIRDAIKNIKADIKKAHKSITMLFNGAVGTLALYLPDVLSFMPQLQQYVEAPTYKTWMVVLLAGNFLLRFKTDKPMRDKV